MSIIRFTERLATEYRDLYRRTEALPARFAEIDEIADRAEAGQDRYAAAAKAVGVPWYFVAAVHNLESAQRFDRHLHNGDSLEQRTVRMPAGHPRAGEPPFTWEESAADALRLRRLERVDDWDLPRLLYELESYNGFGYRLYHPEVLSPYLWSFASHYDRGKYIADGTWSHTARSRQCGAAVLLRRLEERGTIGPQIGAPPRTPVYFYSRQYRPQAEQLQRFLNASGAVLRIDGVAGPMTSDAFRRYFGHYLHRDPRA